MNNDTQTRFNNYQTTDGVVEVGKLYYKKQTGYVCVVENIVKSSWLVGKTKFEVISVIYRILDRKESYTFTGVNKFYSQYKPLTEYDVMRLQ